MRGLFAALIFGAFSFEANAGPDATINHLMDDSVSMLDFGILRMNLTLKEKDLGGATYLWDENRIVISHILTLKYFGDHEAAENACAEWVKNVRRVAWIDTETGKPTFSTSWFATYFSHNGFKRLSAPQDLDENLDKIFQLKCIAFTEDGQALTVTAPLIGTGYSLEK